MWGFAEISGICFTVPRVYGPILRHSLLDRLDFGVNTMGGLFHPRVAATSDIGYGTIRVCGRLSGTESHRRKASLVRAFQMVPTTEDRISLVL